MSRPDPGALDYASQLPISAYFDMALYQREMESLFACGPRYLGHELMVPQAGDFQVIDDGARYLRRTNSGVEVFSNVCRHRQAQMLEGRGNARHTVCPLHRWVYDEAGQLIAAPHFDANPCLHLPQTATTGWNGLLFEAGRDIEADLKDMGVARDLDFSDYVFHGRHVESYEGNWKTFIEVYLEDYHVNPFHPGLGRFVECKDLAWQFGDWYSVQTVGIRNGLARAGSAVYEAWHRQVLARSGGGLPSFGAIWLTYYPNLMVEWYPHTLVISAVVPDGPRRYRNVVEFYYPRDIVENDPDFIAAEQAAYQETADEDRIIIDRMEAGRASLWAAGRNEIGPYQLPMEAGMQHFHRFLRRELGEVF